MSAVTGIGWTDSTWSPILGCSPASAGCAGCYATRDVWRMAHNPNPKISGPRQGLVEKTSRGALRWTGKVSLVHEQLNVPLRWKKPRRIFVGNQSDLFHPEIPDDFIDRVFAVMALAGHQTFQVLTKRPERMRSYIEGAGRSIQRLQGPARELGRTLVFEGHGLVPWPLPNVWLGVSVEDQATADARIPHLFETPAALRFLSCEPLLEHVWLPYLGMVGIQHPMKPAGVAMCSVPGISWVIAGGESGYRARPCDPAWIRSIVEQCAAAGIPAFVKQLGRAWAASTDSYASCEFGAVSTNGSDPDEWPDDLRVQQFPEVVRG